VKLVKGAATLQDSEEFLAELEMCAPLRHPHVNRLVGVSLRQQPWLAVLEFMPFGDVHALLSAFRRKKVPITNMERCYLCAQIASGMKYVASQRVLHIDLAARNCLCGEANVVKVADFGLSQKLSPGVHVWRLTTSLRLAQRWLAPESHKYHRFSEASDVWSFGITCWEIASYAKLPFPKVKLHEVKDYVLGGERPLKPAGCSPGLNKLMMDCWNHSPTDRPDFSALFATLQAMGKAEARTADVKLMRNLGKLARGTPGSEGAHKAELPWIL